MAGLVIIRKAINTPILFNWYEFICHSLLSRLPSSSLPVTPGFIFVHTLSFACWAHVRCLLSIQWGCSVDSKQMWVWDAAVAATEEKACLHNPACMNKVCVVLSSVRVAPLPFHAALLTFSFYPLCRFCLLFGSLPLVDSFGCFYLTFSSLSV